MLPLDSKLQILFDVERSRTGERRVRVHCECGNEKDVFYQAVRTGLTKSCGCIKTQMLKKRNHAKPKFTSEIGIPTEIAWAAGFIDGEGSSGCYEAGDGRVSVVLQVTQSYTEPLERLQRALGGLGRINGPYKKTGVGGKIHKDSYRWSVHNFEEVQQVVAILWEYVCSEKKDQAVAALIAWRERKR